MRARMRRVSRAQATGDSVSVSEAVARNERQRSSGTPASERASPVRAASPTGEGRLFFNPTLLSVGFTVPSEFMHKCTCFVIRMLRIF